MHRSAFPSRETKSYLRDAVDRRGRRGVIGVVSHVPAPWKAHLCASGLLSWTWSSSKFVRGAHRIVTPQPRKMDPRFAELFAALAQSTDEQIRRFAEHWGPLKYGPPQPLTSLTESVSDWRSYARLADAIIRCSGARSELATRQDWEIISTWLGERMDPVVLDPRSHVGRLYGVRLIASALNQWYSQASGMNIVGLEHERLLLRPSTTTLFGTIAVQLAHWLSDAQDKIACHHCGRIFTPKLRPRLGARSFCAKCRKEGKAKIYAMRDYRARLARSKPDRAASS